MRALPSGPWLGHLEPKGRAPHLSTLFVGSRSSYDSPMTSPFGALAVIADPRAGVVDQLPTLERALDARGVEHRILVANGSDPSTLATDALDEGFRFLVAVSDDVTVQAVVNGMFRDGRAIRDEPILGVVAAGSGCDLVRSFGLPGDTESAAAHLAGENTYALDLMKITATG